MGQTKSDRASAEFKAAARRVFARQGYQAAKITDITAEAGRAAGGIYRYFPSKAAILRALAEDFNAARHDRVAGSSGHGHTMTSEDDVRRHVAAYWLTYREYLPEMSAIFQASMSDPEFAAIWQEIRQRDFRVWRKHIRELRAHHGLTTKDVSRKTMLVLSLLEHYCYLHQMTGEAGGGTDDQVIDTLTRFIHAGILG